MESFYCAFAKRTKSDLTRSDSVTVTWAKSCHLLAQKNWRIFFAGMMSSFFTKFPSCGFQRLELWPPCCSRSFSALSQVRFSFCSRCLSRIANEQPTWCLRNPECQTQPLWLCNFRLPTQLWWPTSGSRSDPKRWAGQRKFSESCVQILIDSIFLVITWTKGWQRKFRELLMYNHHKMTIGTM